MAAKPQDQPPPPATAAPVRDPLLETVALLLLSMATVGTAWCSYQASTWGAIAGQLGGQAAAASRQAAQDELQSYQVALLDVMLFSQYVDAHFGSNETLARFYADRFRDEAKTAFNTWEAMKPFGNPNA